MMVLLVTNDYNNFDVKNPRQKERTHNVVIPNVRFATSLIIS